jgi:hypothetical protein
MHGGARSSGGPQGDRNSNFMHGRSISALGRGRACRPTMRSSAAIFASYSRSRSVAVSVLTMSRDGHPSETCAAVRGHSYCSTTSVTSEVMPGGPAACLRYRAFSLATKPPHHCNPRPLRRIPYGHLSVATLLSPWPAGENGTLALFSTPSALKN